MDFLESFRSQLFLTDKTNFDEKALALFHHQYEGNTVYKEYVDHLGINVNQTNSIIEIPFIPIEFFKSQSIKTGQWKTQKTFLSSGTSQQIRSQHHIDDLAFYCRLTTQGFEKFYGPLDQYRFLAVLPSYLGRGESSSLITMVANFIQKSGSAESAFYLDDLSGLKKKLSQKGDFKTILIGVSFALLDVIEMIEVADHTELLIIETGGMKGRREELIREELHDRLKLGFGVSSVHSEYGMTELLSQAYALKNGIFATPPWMRVLIRDLNDPFEKGLENIVGGVNIIDLGNVHSCAFIETQDLGKQLNNSEFEILGRFDNSDIRGCNLLVY